MQRSAPPGGGSARSDRWSSCGPEATLARSSRSRRCVSVVFDQPVSSRLDRRLGTFAATARSGSPRHCRSSACPQTAASALPIRRSCAARRRRWKPRPSSVTPGRRPNPGEVDQEVPRLGPCGTGDHRRTFKASRGRRRSTSCATGSPRDRPTFQSSQRGAWRRRVQEERWRGPDGRRRLRESSRCHAILGVWMPLSVNRILCWESLGGVLAGGYFDRPCVGAGDSHLLRCQPLSCRLADAGLATAVSQIAFYARNCWKISPQPVLMNTASPSRQASPLCSFQARLLILPH